MTIDPLIIEDIRRLVQGNVLTGAFMRDLTSFRIGGRADVVIEPLDVENMAKLRSFLSQEGIPSILLGAGTNVLCSDKGYRGVVVRTKALKHVKTIVNGSGLVRIAAGAGVGLTALTNRTYRAGGHGMEPLWGIPGSVGGSIAINAGAGEVATCDFVEELKLVTDKGTVIGLKKSDLDFGYRSARLPDNGVVVEALFQFMPGGDPLKIREQLGHWMRVRRERQPWRVPSAGCVFKNPAQGDSAGAIIERLGFKGISEGCAQISPIHANFIVNKGGAMAEDVLRLIRKIRRRVVKEYRVQLELEIKLIGEGLEHADPW